MAKTQWKILFITFLISCASLSLLIVALSTSHWVSGEASSADPILGGHVTVNYGLLSGSLSRQVITSPTTYDLQMTCLYSENICAQSCQPTPETREREVMLLLYGKPVATSCDGVVSSVLGDPEEGLEERRKLFISAGLYASTLVFLAFALIFSCLAALLSAVNVVANPVYRVFSVPGLYIWNGATAVTGLLVMVLWAKQFSSLQENIAIQDTLRILYPFDSAGKANLGFSFFMVFAAIILNGSMNLGLLFWRQKIINREPPPVTIQMDKPEVILLY